MPELFDDSRLAQVLLDISLFDNLDHNQVRSVIEICNQRLTNPGEVLCESKTIDEQLIVLLDGSLRLESIDGKLLDELIPTRVIGEMGVFTGQTRSSRVVAEGEALILELQADDFQDLLEDDPQLGHHMLASLIKMLYTRVHDVNEEMEVLREQVSRFQDRLQELAPDDPVLRDLI
ncbi:MAG: cyclic nucleotide-binding domain-containing protein [bacterium]|nr:cyclic nucleotide-binding domain-containing protein [bacterium]